MKSSGDFTAAQSAKNCQNLFPVSSLKESVSVCYPGQATTPLPGTKPLTHVIPSADIVAPTAWAGAGRLPPAHHRIASGTHLSSSQEFAQEYKTTAPPKQPE